jgi:hypothetical protein
MWRRNTGCFATEIALDGVCWWLGTFSSPELSASTYDFDEWTFRRPHAEVNFPGIDSLKEIKFLSPQVHMVTREKEKENLRAFL